MKRAILMTVFLPFVVSFSAAEEARGNRTVPDFQTAKKMLRKIHGDSGKTFYCNCDFQRKSIDSSRCGFSPKRRSERSFRMEWEHVVPAYFFGGKLPEWKNGHEKCMTAGGRRYRGRRCAEESNELFRRMQADLYNLKPSVGELNEARGSRYYAEIDGEKRDFGRCDFEVSGGRIEPAENIRGDIARIYFYMDWAYPGFGLIHDKNRAMMEKWSRDDPIDEEECLRARKTEAIQKNRNPFVLDFCARR